MLQIAKSVKFDLQSFPNWSELPKDIRWLIIKMSKTNGTYAATRLHMVSKDFFKAIFSLNPDKLPNYLFNDNYSYNLSRDQRYIIYTLINPKNMSCRNKLRYLEFEYTIINKNESDKGEKSYTNQDNDIFGITHDYIIGLIHYIFKKSNKLGNSISLNYCKKCNNIEWLNEFKFYQ